MQISELGLAHPAGTISGDMPTTDLQLKILMEAPAEAREVGNLSA